MSQKSRTGLFHEAGDNHGRGYPEAVPVTIAPAHLPLMPDNLPIEARKGRGEVVGVQEPTPLPTDGHRVRTEATVVFHAPNHRPQDLPKTPCIYIGSQETYERFKEQPFYVLSARPGRNNEITGEIVKAGVCYSLYLRPQEVGFDIRTVRHQAFSVNLGPLPTVFPEIGFINRALQDQQKLGADIGNFLTGRPEQTDWTRWPLIRPIYHGIQALGRLDFLDPNTMDLAVLGLAGTSYLAAALLKTKAIAGTVMLTPKPIAGINLGTITKLNLGNILKHVNLGNIIKHTQQFAQQVVKHARPETIGRLSFAFPWVQQGKLALFLPLQNLPVSLARAMALGRIAAGGSEVLNSDQLTGDRVSIQTNNPFDENWRRLQEYDLGRRVWVLPSNPLAPTASRQQVRIHLHPQRPGQPRCLTLEGNGRKATFCQSQPKGPWRPVQTHSAVPTAPLAALQKAMEGTPQPQTEQKSSETVPVGPLSALQKAMEGTPQPQTEQKNTVPVGPLAALQKAMEGTAQTNQKTPELVLN